MSTLNLDQLNAVLYREERAFTCTTCQVRFSSHTLLAQHRKTCSPRRLFVCQVCKIVFNKEADIVNHKMALHRCEEVAMFSDIYLVMMVDFTQNVKERRAARKRQISRHKERKMAEEMRAFVPGSGFPRPRVSIVQELAGKDGYSSFSSTVNDAFGIEELGLGGVGGVEPQDSYAHDMGMFDYSDHKDDDVNVDVAGDADDAEAAQEGGKPQIYECDACTIMFASKKAYTKHLAGHKNEEQFICEACRTVFREEEEFNRHKLECSQFLRQQEVAPPVPEIEPELPAPPLSAPAPPPEEEMPPHLAALRADSPSPPPSPSKGKPSGPGAIFRCAVCKEVFSNDWALFEHLEMHPAKKRRYPCDQCGKIFLCSTKIIVHKNIVHRSREQCENCGRVYENKKDRRAHVLTCVLNETHKCTECDVTCRTRVSLYFHMRTHMNREITQCGTCGQKFNRKSRLKWHVQTVHQNAWAFKCDICDQRFRYKKGLISHLSAQHNQGDRKFECDVCGDKFIFQYRLKRHKLRHLRSREIILPFKCDKCDKSFREKRYLDNHKIRIHLHKPFKCPDCSRAFLLQQNLDDHLRTEHTHRPFRCEVCALCFTNKNRLQVHMMQHKGKMPHTCQLCGLSFAYKCKLTRHMTTHEDMETRKTFQCMICGKGFAYGKSVTVHMKKVHMGVREHQCKYCNKAFSDRFHLNKHMRTHTGEKLTRPFKCTFCPKDYSRHEELNVHVAKAHLSKRVQSADGN